MNALALPLPVICLITNRHALAPDARTIDDEIAALEEQVDLAVAGGVNLIQVRERDLDARDLTRLVARLIQQMRGHARLVVNDRADVALAAGADGVHLRADGPAADQVRPLAPPDWIVGRSIHLEAEARRFTAEDYLIFGTVFPSRSKPAGSPVAGVDALADAAVLASVPVLAIGGVTPERAAACRDAGAAGIAAIELFLPPGRMPGARGPRAAAAALLAAWISGS